MATYIGTSRNDILVGSSSGDMIIGWDGNDAINGRGGGDTLYGRRGDDTITGGRGVDTVAGGAGADAFAFAHGHGGAGPVNDRIADFRVGVDRLRLPADAAAGTWEDAGGQWVYWSGGNNEDWVQLLGVHGATLAQLTGPGGAPPAGRPSLLHHEPGDLFFTNAQGREVYLAGIHTWTDVQDRDGSPFDFGAFLALQTSIGGNVIRLWATDSADDHGAVSPAPFNRNAAGRFDLNSFDQRYFDNLRARVEEAGDHGMYTSVMMFNGWAWHQDASQGHSPYSGSNNVNGIDADHGTVMSLRDPAVTAIQEAYIRKVVDTVGDLPNVLYEVANEANNNNAGWAWQNHMLSVIERADGGRHPAGITAAEWWSGDRNAINGRLRSTDADWTSPDGADYGIGGSVPPPATGAKVSIVDTDHIWGLGGQSVGWVWQAFTRGHNVWQMDTLQGEGIAGISRAYPLDGTGLAQEDAGREGIRQTRMVARMVDLNDVREAGALSSTGFALADPGDGEFIVYAPRGGTFSVDLSGAAGQLDAYWMDLGSSALTAAGAVRAGAVADFASPHGSAVLVLTNDPFP